MRPIIGGVCYKGKRRSPQSAVGSLHVKARESLHLQPATSNLQLLQKTLILLVYDKTTEIYNICIYYRDILLNLRDCLKLKI